MKKNQIKFKSLTEDQIIQLIDLNDYFGDGIPTITKPVTKKKFILNELRGIMDDEEVSADQAFKMCHGFGDGDSNGIFVTVVDGVVQIVVG